MKLSPSMTVAEFDNGYWYAVDVKRFAHAIGIPSASRLRKDQLEPAIRRFLATRRLPPAPRPRPVPAERDVDRGLRLDRRVVRYTNDPGTKAFLEREAKKLSPSYRRRSGARYRLNRWRDAQLAGGRPITYRDLVREYVRLSEAAEPYALIPSGRYINFLSEFLRNEPRATRAAAIRAWHAVKRMTCPNTYTAWQSHTRHSRR
jgi:SAP domain-containing new25